MSMNDMLSRDRSLIESKNVFRHIKEREEAVRRNVDEVVNFILGERKTGYIAKSVLLTARANYYGIQEKEVEYLTWTQFLKKAKLAIISSQGQIIHIPRQSLLSSRGKNH